MEEMVAGKAAESARVLALGGFPSLDIVGVILLDVSKQTEDPWRLLIWVLG